MTNSTSTAELPSHIQQLLDQRQQHTAAIRQIDDTLARVTAALGGRIAPATVSKPTAPMAVKAPAVKAKKGKRSKFTVSTNELVLSFVKANKNPTTQKIMQHLASEGRTVSSGSNALSVLTSAKKLKRTPLGKGMLGSTYSIT
jgi:hypothetical protein